MLSEDMMKNLTPDCVIYRLWMKISQSKEEAEKLQLLQNVLGLCEKFKKHGAYKTIYTKFQGRNEALQKKNTFLETSESQFNSEMEIIKNNMSKEVNAKNNDAAKDQMIKLAQLYFEKGIYDQAHYWFLKAYNYSIKPEDKAKLACQMGLSNYFADNQTYVGNISGDFNDLYKVCNEKDKNLLVLLFLLESIKKRKYEDAFRYFSKLEVSSENISNFFTEKELAAIYCITALKSLNRKTVKTSFIDPIGKKFALILPESKDALLNYINCEYSKMISNLQSVSGELKYDVMINPRLVILFEQIREKCLAEYLKAFSMINMVALAEEFGTTIPDIEEMIINMSKNKLIKAKIDAKNKTIQVAEDDSRMSCLLTMQRDTEAFLTGMKDSYLKQTLQVNNLKIIKKPKMRGMFGKEYFGAMRFMNRGMFH